MTRAALATFITSLTMGCRQPAPSSEPAGPTRDTSTQETSAHDTSTPTPDEGVSSRLSELYPTLVIVSFTQEQPASVHIAFTFDGQTRLTPVRELSLGPHEEILLGIPYQTEVSYEIISETAREVTRIGPLTAKTGAMPPSMPISALVQADSLRYDPTMAYTLVSATDAGSYGFGERWWALVVDRQGRIVWAHQASLGSALMQPLLDIDGDALLLDDNSFWGSLDEGADSRVLEMRLDGVIEQIWETPGLHHPYTRLPDGRIVYGAIVAGTSAQEEEIVAVDSAGGRQIVFACRDWLDSIGASSETCGANSITYDEPSDALLTTWFTFEAVVEITLATGTVPRWFGHVSDGYTADPPSATPWYPHGAVMTDAGTLLLSTHAAEDDLTLVAREYTIDDGADTLHQVWSTGEGSGVMGRQLGEADRLPGGGTLHNFGTTPLLREYAPNGDVVWEVSFDSGALGRSTPLPDDLYALVRDRP